MRKTSDYNKAVKETAKELGLPSYVVHDAVSQFFHMAVDDIKSGEFQGASMVGFGKFVVKPGRKELYDKEVLNKDV